DISNKTIGIIGLGRIGRLLVKFLGPFNCKILVNDIKPDNDFIKKNNLFFCNKYQIYKKADIISLHIPLTPKTYNMIQLKQLQIMKNNCVLINTSRGGIINEKDLYAHLKCNSEFYAAVDVFQNEPYTGKLCYLNNIILTPHLGSCSEQSRYLMELGAVQNIIDFYNGANLKLNSNFIIP
nr:hypothetical protein [Candidatus Dependentiae bacterium]